MAGFQRGLIAAAILAFSFGPESARAALINHGSSGQYFQDTNSGLYWYDPAQFVGQSRAAIDAFVSADPFWEWATSAQISGLVGQSVVSGTLVDVMGAPQFILNDGGPRWIGFYDSTVQPDGWLVQSFGNPGFVTVTDGGSQASVTDGWNPGAWLVSRLDPEAAVPEPGTMALMGLSLAGLGLLRRARR